jgi:hypothetical protein
LWDLTGGITRAPRRSATVDPKRLECRAPEGESPVGADRGDRCVRLPSTTGPVKPGGKLGGPPPKTADHPSPIAKSTVRER